MEFVVVVVVVVVLGGAFIKSFVRSNGNAKWSVQEGSMHIIVKQW